MKNSRRSFISKTALGLGAFSTASFTSKLRHDTDINNIKNRLSGDESEYWLEVKKLFPTDKNDTYFNNGTLGVQSNYVLNAVINDMRNNAINGAKTDYKGEGPNLLAGYDPYLKIREKLGKILNCNYKEISLIQNATFGMNFVAHGLDLKKGDEVINTNQEHGGGYAACFGVLCPIPHRRVRTKETSFGFANNHWYNFYILLPVEFDRYDDNLSQQLHHLLHMTAPWNLLYV